MYKKYLVCFFLKATFRYKIRNLSKFNRFQISYIFKKKTTKKSFCTIQINLSDEKQL